MSLAILLTKEKTLAVFWQCCETNLDPATGILNKRPSATHKRDFLIHLRT